MCRKQEERLHYLFIIINSDVGLLICRGLLCIVLQLIIIIFGSRTEKVIVLKENKDGNVHNLVLIRFPVFLWLYLHKVLIFIRMIMIPVSTLPKKGCFIHFILLLIMGKVFVIRLMYAMI